MSEDSKHYYFILDDDTLTTGSTVTIDEESTPVVTDPGRVDLYDFADTNDIDDFLSMITNTLDGRKIRLAQLTPNGDVFLDHIAQAWCTNGWTISTFLPYTLLFGAHGDRIVDVVTKSDRELKPKSGPRAQAFINVIDAQRVRDPRWSACDAARRTLAIANAADCFWWEIGAYFPAALALRARPYIGTTTAWTQETYDELVAAYTTAFGEPVHPDDALHTA